MSKETVLYEVKSNTTVITINRPDVYNALNAENKKKLAELVRDAESDSQVSAIILTGNGKAFCTGQDLNDRNIQGANTNLGNALEIEWNPLIKAIYYCQKPVIAAVNGVCAGAGIALALNADLVVSTPKTKFVGGFGKLALCLDAGSTYHLTKALGPKKVFEFYMTNSAIMSEELERVGLINSLSENVLEKALEYAQNLHLCDGIALQRVKENIKTAYEKSFNDSLEAETLSQRFLGSRESYREGIKAFFEKRNPDFRK